MVSSIEQSVTSGTTTVYFTDNDEESVISDSFLTTFDSIGERRRSSNSSGSKDARDDVSELSYFTNDADEDFTDEESCSSTSCIKGLHGEFSEEKSRQGTLNHVRGAGSNMSEYSAQRAQLLLEYFSQMEEEMDESHEELDCYIDKKSSKTQPAYVSRLSCGSSKAMLSDVSLGSRDSLDIDLFQDVFDQEEEVEEIDDFQDCQTADNPSSETEMICSKTRRRYSLQFMGLLLVCALIGQYMVTRPIGKENKNDFLTNFSKIEQEIAPLSLDNVEMPPRELEELPTQVKYESEDISPIDEVETEPTPTEPPRTQYSKTLGYISSKFRPVWYDRDHDWKGRTYTDAIEFCAKQDSRIPCPYQAYCPMGPLGTPNGGYRSESGEMWAPIIDSPNGWVQIGSENSCLRYTSLHSTPPKWGITGEDNKAITRHIMCCKAPSTSSPKKVNEMKKQSKRMNVISQKEQAVLDDFHPIWFGRQHGYTGSTHEDAAAFCENVADMSLCPIEAYCPPGSTSKRPLFLKKEAFDGDKWAPIEGNNAWVSIGKKRSRTCKTYDEINDGMSPSWGVDGERRDLKEHVMCCANKEHKAKEATIVEEMKPIWINSSHGWNGGSHTEAAALCNNMGGRDVCPIESYCPHGPGKSVIGGHMADFGSAGEQWAPVQGSNEWVMIGKKNGNSQTTCMSHRQLEGGKPQWGLNNGRAESKMHIMCCSTSHEEELEL